MKIAELFILYCRQGEKASSSKIYLPAKLICCKTNSETKTYGKLILVKSII